MKIGVILPNFGPQASTRELVATARRAERLGFDSVWTTDHLILPRADAEVYGRIFEAVTTLAFLAGATRRIRLGVSSLVLPQRDPVLAAKQIATLDRLSAGRAMLCVGVGWSAGEYANLGQRFENRGRRLNEAIQLLRLLWAAEDPAGLTFSGEFYALQEARSAPPPAQGAALPIWVGGNSAAAIRRAAALGDGWHPTRLALPQFRHGVERLRGSGRPLTISLRLRLNLQAEADETPGMLSGPPARLIDQLSAYVEAGLEYPVLAFGGEDPAARQETMARFMEDIAPALPDPSGG